MKLLTPLCSGVAVVATLFITGCFPEPPKTSVPPPTANQIFEPDPVSPQNNFAADNGTVQVTLTSGNVLGDVCYSTDGSDPSACANILNADNVAIDCGSDTGAVTVRTIKVYFNWFDGVGGSSYQTISGNYILDCTPPEADTDGDGVVDSQDNCPTVPNPGQEDNNGIDDGFGQGDACEDEPIADADGDTKEDDFDNCPNVWNINQSDDDNDGIGNVCDPEPLGPPVQALANEDLTKAFVSWKDKVQCAIRCSDPTGGGNQGTITCDNGGTANWNVDLNIFGGQADSYFTYSNCEYTTDEGVTLIVDGQLVQYSDFNGNGNEGGSVTITGGDYVGSVTSHAVFHNRSRDGGYFSAGCTVDPFVDKACAAGGVEIDYHYPDWSCLASDPLCVQPSEPLVDSDGDGVFDQYDNCPNDNNPAQANADFDNEGDACDLVFDGQDSDGDGIPDSVDNCVSTPNASQADQDGDGLGDACDDTIDPDTDGDGWVDSQDNCIYDANPDQTDTDGDGQGDACDTTPDGDDSDNDGVPDVNDNCPDDNNPSQSDMDGDGVGDLCDPDPGYVLIYTKMNSSQNSSETDPSLFPGRCVRSYNPSDSSEDSTLDPKRWFGSDVFNSPAPSGAPCTGDMYRWIVLQGSTAGTVLFKNVLIGKCMEAIDNALDFTNVSLKNCDTSRTVQQWNIERYDEASGVEFDLRYPSRIRSYSDNWCMYAEDYGNGNVFGAENNCQLGLGEGNRQFGIYFGGDFFDSEPYEP